MLARFSDLIVKFGNRCLLPFLKCEMAKLGVHLGVLMGLPFDRDFQSARGGQPGFGIEQIEVAERVHHFLICGGLKVSGRFFITGLASDSGEITILDVGHRLASKRGFEIGEGDRGRGERGGYGGH